MACSLTAERTAFGTDNGRSARQREPLFMPEAVEKRVGGGRRAAFCGQGG
jgi:hypothetical protein